MGAKRSRDERKDRAAQRRREEQARDKRQRRLIFGISIPIAAIVIAIVPLTNWYNAHQRGIKHGIGYVAAASTQAKAVGCTGVRNDRQMKTSIVKTGTTVDYAKLTKAAGNALPPTSGPRYSDPLPDSPTFYAVKAAPKPERAVANLYYGYVVVWYDKKLPAADVKTLQTASSQTSRTIFVPWTRSIFPGDQHLVLTAWDRTQRCKTASVKVITDFATAHADDTTGKGWASPSAPSPGGGGTSPTTVPTVLPTPQTTVTLPVPSGSAATRAPGTATASPAPTASVPTSTYSVPSATPSAPLLSASPAK